jgi:hypothetical protein
MSFLAPLFFAGLAALAIPVLIHLIHRERKEVIEFPSLMFLQRIPYRSVRRQKLRHILLLALRCFALAIVVLAFARPFFSRSSVATPAGVGAREVVVLVDRSYSLGYGDRWTRAVAAARNAIPTLGGADRATVISFDNQATALTAPSRDRGVLDASITSLKPGSEGTRYGPPFKLASQILAGSNLPRKEVVLVSDFQRIAWSTRDEVSLPAGTTVNMVDIAGDTAPADLAVADVAVERNDATGRDRAIVAARLTNTGKSPAENVNVTLELNGRSVDSRRVTVPASGATQVRFGAIAIPSGTTAGVVALASSNVTKANQLAANDKHFFTVSPDASVSVLVLEPPRPRQNQSLYFARALAIGDRPSFKVDVKPASAFIPADLDGRALVVFDEAAPPSTAAANQRLRDFVASGGGLLVVTGDQLPSGAWGGSWNDVLPGVIGSLVDRTGEAGGTLAWVEYDNPVFDLFNAPRSGDFATARFLRYRRLAVRADSGRGQGDTLTTRAGVSSGQPGGPADTSRSRIGAPHVLARFDDGGVALAERTLGRGRVMLWASTLDNYWNDLPLQPVFLPYVHQLAKYAARYSDAKLWYTAGDVLDLSRHGELTGTACVQRSACRGVIVEAPSGTRSHLATVGEGLIPLHEQGFYEIRPEGAPAGTGRRVAVNLDLTEASTARIDPQELRLAVLAGGAAGRNVAGAATTTTREDEERKQTIWWYLLAMAGVLLAVETVLSNRLSRPAT